jgi:hypothetical protein
MDSDSSTAEPAPPRAGYAKLRRLARLFAWGCLGPATFWAVAAHYFDVRAPWLCAPLAAAYGLGMLAVWLWARHLWKALVTASGFLLVLGTGFVTAQTPMDELSPWPQIRSTNGYTVTLYLPQVERWTTNWFVARAVVEVKPARATEASAGVVWFEAHGSVDRSNRIVTLDRFDITKARFPDAPDNGSNALAIVRDVIPSGARTVSLDYLITALGFEQAAARQGPHGLNHTPPDIVWTTNRAVLVVIAGEPVLHPVPGAALERVVNTPALLVRDNASGRFYLAGTGQWFAADALPGPWSLVQVPPAEVAALASAKPEGASAPAGEPAPRIIVSTRPAELLMTDGLPNFISIRGTALQYAADTDNQLFFHNTERMAYLLLSGRWFKAASLNGPWSYVAPHDLPDDFARIPPNSPQAAVLASVPGTSQAELALVANLVPTTATVNRHNTKIELAYDGEPQFKPIEGTDMSYAVNAQLPVVHTGESYYAVDNGVWFAAASPTGPWQVATEVPEEIYTIPPGSPVYYATFARVYDADTNNVEVGYTAGYTGAYEDDGTMVYGTGCDYEPWYSATTYYGWGWTWGYGYAYLPWYGWWTWRPWWNERGGLRAALIDNIYNRWQPGVGVTPHDRVAGAVANVSQRQGFAGYPAVYGRFQGATRAAALTPPANTLVLNPYSRPKTPAHAGDIPHGAQLLTSVRQSPGGGRDLYASPDGNIYQRRSDGWYHRQAGGNWSFCAPAQGTIERGQVASARGAQAGAGQAYRINAGQNAPAARTQMRGDRVPNAGSETRAQDVAALDRQYYARALGQMRAQNVRPTRNVIRPARGGGRRR